MNNLAKILVDDDLVPVHPDFQYWHLVVERTGAAMAFCSGEVMGNGDSQVLYETKTVKRGGITCPECLKRIKEIKSIKL